jgi:hypothetical protein
MRSSLLVGLALGALCGGQTLTIRLYNLTNAPAAVVDRASTVTGQLLAGAGVTAVWQTGTPDSFEGHCTDMSAAPAGSRVAPDGRDYLVVRLARGIPGHADRTDLGYALPHARQGVHATVYYDMVEKLFFSARAMPGVKELLGAAIAHEIGHVLLGSTEHSAAGIMKARWGQAEFQLLACHRLQFTPEDREAIARKRSERLELSSSTPRQSMASETAIESRRCSAVR